MRPALRSWGRRGTLGGPAAIGLCLLAWGCATRSGVADGEPRRLRSGLVASSAVLSSEPWSYGDEAGLLLITPHYRIYTTQTQPMMLSRTPGFLEAALAHYRSVLTPGAPLPEPAQPLETFIFRTRAQWEDMTRSLLGGEGQGGQAAPFLKIQRGGYAWGGRAVLFDLGATGGSGGGGAGGADTLLIAAHEGWHQYTQRTFARALPVWLEEGIATYMEGHRWGGDGPDAGSVPVFLPWANPRRYDALREAASAGRLMSLPSLLESSPTRLVADDGLDNADAAVYYAQLWALVHFLHEGAGGRYAAGLGAVAADAARGAAFPGQAPGAAGGDREPALWRHGPAVFAAYFTPDLHAADAEYQEYVRRLVRPGTGSAGGRGAVIDGRSPVAGAP